MAFWGITPQIVKDKTDEDVELVDVAMAAGTVEIYANRTEEASGAMKKRDLHWIRQAIVWQAAWLIQQPGYTGRQNANRTTQDGAIVDYGPIPSIEGREYAVTLAPLASRALKNLSWKGSRSVRVKRETSAEVYDPRKFLFHDGHGWGIL